MTQYRFVALGVVALTCLSGAGIGASTGMWIGEGNKNKKQ
jgi:hypothetical protein|tara:strand:+ start:1470 stop:1589 length:120 start_codon:yes stop_codon:yes gene_type:complete